MDREDEGCIEKLRDGSRSSGNALWMKKRGVPRHHVKHAAWELLSPDLRCFWKHHVEISL
jgi:hypothetical protein